MAEDSSKELFEFFQKMWNPMAFPIPGMFQPMVVADLIFGVLFAWAYVALRATTAKTGG